MLRIIAGLFGKDESDCLKVEADGSATTFSFLDRNGYVKSKFTMGKDDTRALSQLITEAVAHQTQQRDLR
jgi:hypothetical protein